MERSQGQKQSFIAYLVCKDGVASGQGAGGLVRQLLEMAVSSYALRACVWTDVSRLAFSDSSFC